MEGDEVTGQFRGSHLHVPAGPEFHQAGPAWMPFFNKTISTSFTFVNFQPTEFIVSTEYYVY